VAKYKGLSITLSVGTPLCPGIVVGTPLCPYGIEVGTPLCPYGVAYRRVHRSSISDGFVSRNLDRHLKNSLATRHPKTPCVVPLWKRFRGELVFKAHRLLYHSILGSRVVKKEKKHRSGGMRQGCTGQWRCRVRPLSLSHRGEHL